MNNGKPIGAECSIQWDDGIRQNGVYISLSGSYIESANTDTWGVNDDTIFYYCDDVAEMETMTTPFKVLDYELIFGSMDS